jgi:hypothetical protein
MLSWNLKTIIQKHEAKFDAQKAYAALQEHCVRQSNIELYQDLRLHYIS